MTEHHKLFICSCGDIAHQLVMSYYDDDDIKEVYCTVHLNPGRNIFKRIISFNDENNFLFLNNWCRFFFNFCSFKCSNRFFFNFSK